MTHISLISLYQRQEEYPIKYSLASMRLASAIIDLEGILVNLEGFPLNESSKEITKKILEKNPQIVGFSAYVWTRSKVSEICKLLASQSQETRLIVGGPEILESSIDKKKRNLIYLAGEGEESLKELVLQYKIASGKLSLPSGKIPSLEMTSPLFSKKMNSFFTENPLKNGFSWWESSRGCLYKCAFCGHRSDQMRKYSQELIKEEIQNIGKLSIKRICIVDPILGGDILNGKNILRLFKKYSPGTAIRAYMRPEFLDTEYINLLGDSNIESLEIGIQTINPDVPKFIRSNNLEKIDFLLPQLRQNKIPWQAQLITGLIGDTPQGHCESLRYVIEKLRPSRTYSYHLTVINNTTLASLTDKSKDLWIRSNKDNCRAFESSSYSRREMMQMLKFGSAITSLYNYLQENNIMSMDVYSFDRLHKIAGPIIESNDSEISHALILEDRYYLKNLWGRLLGK